MIPPVWRRLSPFLKRNRLPLYGATLLFIPALLALAVPAIFGGGEALETAAGAAFCICMFASMTAAGLLFGAMCFDPTTTGEEDGDVLLRAADGVRSWLLSAALLLWHGLAAMFLIPLVNALLD